MKTLDQNDVAHPTNPFSDHEPIEEQRISASPLETASSKKPPARSGKLAEQADPTQAARDGNGRIDSESRIAQRAKQDLEMPGSK
jgi:hypothetical protein